MFELATRTIRLRHACLVYSIIPWDSTYLRNTTAEIKEFSFATKQEARHLLSKLTKKIGFAKGDLLFFKTSPLQVAALRILTTLGFYVVEEAVEITFDLAHWNPSAFPQYTTHGYRLVPASPRYLPAIKKIAAEAFIADRYHLDTNIPSRGANRRYVGWVETSRKGPDEVFAFIDAKDAVAGFFIIAKHKRNTNLRLAAIDPSLKGKGLGKLLYYTMFTLLKNRKNTTIQTQISLTNTPVLNVYTYLVHPKVTRLDIVLHYMV